MASATIGCQSAVTWNFPPALARAVMAAAEAKASRHAITPQLRPKEKESLPVASFVTLSGRDGTIKVRCLCRPSRRAATTGSTGNDRCADEIGSLPLKCKRHERAQITMCCVESARVAPSRPVRNAPYRSRNGIKMVRSDKSTLCDIKLAAGEGNGRPRPGGPRETPCRAFYDHTMCSYLTGAGAQAAPARPRPPPLRKMESKR